MHSNSSFIMIIYILYSRDVEQVLYWIPKMVSEFEYYVFFFGIKIRGWCFHKNRNKNIKLNILLLLTVFIINVMG